MRWPQALLLLLLSLAVIGFFATGSDQYVTLQHIKTEQAQWIAHWQHRPLETAAIFGAGYIGVTAFSLPGAAILTLLAGAVFGIGWGTLIVSFASSIGATLAFLASRYVLRQSVTQRFHKQLRQINQGLIRDGGYYLWSLRLLPVFPYFMINLLMGLTEMKVGRFYWISQLAMLPGTLVYINAGKQLSTIESVVDILSLPIITSFVLIAVFPVAVKMVCRFIERRRLYRPWRKPEVFEHNVVVIGAGPAGLVGAYMAAMLRAKVVLVEKHRMGGDCLNTGCVPSKSLIRAAKFVHQSRNGEALGVARVDCEYVFAEIMERVQRSVKAIAPHDSAERYRQLGVDVISGAAQIMSPWQVAVRTDSGERRMLTTRNIIVATGARPAIPDIPGLKTIDYLTSDTIWKLRERPECLLVLGGGPIGCELAQAFVRLEVRVVLVELGSRLLAREDEEVSLWFEERLRLEGVEIYTNCQTTKFCREGGKNTLQAQQQGQEISLNFDRVLIALGRAANVTECGLENLDIELTEHGTIRVNRFLQTTYPNVFACGDVAGPYQFTHLAGHQGWYACVNALFGGIKKLAVDESVIPWAIFTDPEVARVGMNEQEARKQGIEYEVTRYDLSELDRAVIDEVAEGFIKILTPPGKDKVLGVTIVGVHAAELITEFVLAMKYDLGLNKILSTLHIYPTLAEANKLAAGTWKKQHVSARALNWLSYFHQWCRRG